MHPNGLLWDWAACIWAIKKGIDLKYIYIPSWASDHNHVLTTKSGIGSHGTSAWLLAGGETG
jgi:hypothetical protein